MRRLIAVFLLSVSCATAATSQGDDRLRAGIWGGEHVQMTVSKSGAALQFDCAIGAITEPLKIGSAGRIDATGSYLAERPGAVQTEPQPAPARYVGRFVRAAAGSPAQFMFTISLSEPVSAIGPFTVVEGVEGRVRKCR